jgi:hypothetical protein
MTATLHCILLTWWWQASLWLVRSTVETCFGINVIYCMTVTLYPLDLVVAACLWLVISTVDTCFSPRYLFYDSYIVVDLLVARIHLVS